MNLQYAVYFIIVYTFVHSGATDVQIIQIPINKPDEEYLVQLNKPLVIYFEGTVISRCVWNSTHENIDASEKSITYNSFPNIDSSSLSISSVTKDMSTQWKCTNVNKENFVFNIRVKCAYAVEVNLVGSIISFEMTNESVKEYDGIYNYECEVGDTIDITCRNLYNNGHIILQYHDAQGAIITSSQSYEKEKSDLTFRMLVRGKNVSRSYVDCTYVTPIETIVQEFTYRTIFQITNRNPRRSDGFIITINRMKLTRLPPGLSTIDRYVYKFLSMEHLKITCSKSREQPGAIYGKIKESNNKTVLSTDVKTEQTFTTLIEPVNLDNVTFQCDSKEGPDNLVSEIKFIKEPNRDTYIHGLSASNVLYEYNTRRSWITHYEYTVNQILNLTCITTRDRSPRWVNRKEIISTIHENVEYGTKYINYMFPMNIETIKIITCESKKNGTITQIVTIILHQVLEIPAEEQDLNSNYENNIPENFTSFTVFEIIGTIAGILFATIGAVCALYLWKKKRNILAKLHTCLKKDDNQLHSLTNEVVNEYTYIENEYNYIQNQDVYMITNVAYCGSTQNYVTQKTTSQSDHKEDYYTEIDDKTTNNEIKTTYAVPYETHHINKDKVSNCVKDYENVQNKSNTGYRNLQIKDNISYSNLTNDDLNAS
ncbi:unnamed protein product [Arctia plantaginis]|uniref:Uncharacterized protein n=1 Tax=Arctia plantaginis TaxID=874455 RepID=A0A8S1BKZ4_ARCPL|nr:unnamed protein product [Arctia plantaginis]